MYTAFSPVPSLSQCVRGLKVPPRRYDPANQIVSDCWLIGSSFWSSCASWPLQGDTGRGGTQKEREKGRQREKKRKRKCLAHQPRSEPIIEARYSEPTRCYPIRGPRSPRNWHVPRTEEGWLWGWRVYVHTGTELMHGGKKWRGSTV